ncbi:MAG: copper-translocating P-type ATPase [Clostridium sp.]|nr:copper-translocating P-type ATPase [Clostridium sp.]
MKKKYDVSGMTCSSCSLAVEKAVKKIDGVSGVNVNLLTNTMSATLDDSIDDRAIIEAIEKAGYEAKNHEETSFKKEKINPIEEDIKNMKQRLIASFIFLIPLMYISMGHMVGLPVPSVIMGESNALIFAFVQFLLTIPVLYINKNYFIVGFKAFKNKSPNMDSLIALGAGAAFVYGIYVIFRLSYGFGHGDMDVVLRFKDELYFESAATILTLITLGKFLETKSKGKTSDSINKLMDLAPKTALVLRDNKEVRVNIEEVEVSDIVIIKPGESIPVDGTIIEGNSSIDQSAITGESIPVEKHVGDKVISATINKSGYLKFRADKVGSDTTLSKIIELVEDANATKAPIAKLADKISGIFVPIVISISLITMVTWLFLGRPFEFALSMAITVLVISCPCALGLATPVAIMVGTGKGAENGILIKSAEALETLHSIDSVVLDKTGTITEGKPSVTDIILTGDLNESEFLKIAGSIENLSEHPLAEAILEKVKSEGIELSLIDNFESVPGKGIKGSYEGKTYIAGNKSMLIDNNIDLLEHEGDSLKLSKQGKTAMYFSDDEKLIGIIAVKDNIKEDSKEAIELFHSMGIDVLMLTGDNKETAKAIQKDLNIDNVVAEVFPEDKEREIRNIQESGKKVLMVGDGINDAPALTRADVGIAIGAGTDIAIESADIVLIKSSLLDAVTAVELSRATIRNIKQNLFWAFFYNALGIPLAAGVFYTAFGWKLSPMFAAFAMSLSSIFVVTNALRLKLFKPRTPRNVK